MYGKVLKMCAEQLCSAQQQRVSEVWKKSIIALISNTISPASLNEHKPSPLTSLEMKSFEKPIRKDILLQVETLIDLLQFAYRPCITVEDAVVTLLIFLLFIDFSSAFNTTQSHLLSGKLLNQFKLVLILSVGFQLIDLSVWKSMAVYPVS